MSPKEVCQKIHVCVEEWKIARVPGKCEDVHSALPLPRCAAMR